MNQKRGFGGTWKTEALPESLDEASTTYSLTVSNQAIAIVSSDAVHFKKFTGSWHSATLASLGVEKPPFAEIRWPFPRHVLLTSDSLFLGYNHGEWEGYLYQIPLEENAEKLKGPAKKFPKIQNVVGLAEDRNGDVWVAGGLSHLSSRWASLFILKKGGDDRTIMNELCSAYEYVQPRWMTILTPKPLLTACTDFSGLYLGPEANPQILASQLGILEFSEQDFSFKLKADFRAEPVRARAPYDNRIYPVGFVATSEESYIVATAETGVLVLLKSGDTYSFSQILIPHEAD